MSQDIIAYEQKTVEEIKRPNDIPDIVPMDDWTLVREWLRSKRSSHTKKAYSRNLILFYEFVKGISLSTVTLTDLQDYEASLQKKEPATQAQMLATIKSVLTFGMRTGAIPFNVGAALQLPQGKDKLAERILEPQEIYAMLNEARKSENIRDYAIILILYGTGIRCSELCGLQWRDVQINRDSGQITVLGKRQKTRSIPLHKKIWAILKEYRPSNASPDEYVFPSRQISNRNDRASRRLTESRVWQIISAIALKAGVKHASPHFLRHTHASMALQGNAQGKASLKLVQETLGHTSLAITGRYIHVRPEDSSSNYLDL